MLDHASSDWLPASSLKKKNGYLLSWGAYPLFLYFRF